MQLGVIGLGTMGANLARNAARSGAKVAVYNRTSEKTDAFIKEHGSEGEFIACKTLKELVDALEAPRPILIMVKAGDPVDAVIEELTPLLSKDDILIDGGNSNYKDTERRSGSGPRFIGMGVSGGEEGALNGPSMMPGGNEGAYKLIEPLLMKMAAHVEDLEVERSRGQKESRCVTFIGEGGAGHFVKMVHNGIEYGIMQLIAESYDILKSEGGKSNEELAEIFKSWNEGEDLSSFLVEITSEIFKKGDVLDVIKDAAGQKGTGRWTTESALEYGVAIPTINASLDARIISGSSDLRKKGQKILPESIEQPYPRSEKLVSRVRIALELSIICAYQQGFSLMERASEEKGWDLDFSEIARIWRGGCIIRSSYLKKLQNTYKTGKVDPYELERFEGENQLDWRRVIAIGTGRGIPLPAMTASLSYYDALRREKLPQNLIQAQRDFFGAHTYERVDKKGVFHTDWGK
jgi:6-phosphogluconate dehydrogenase